MPSRKSWFLGGAWLDSRAVKRTIDLDGCVNFRDLGGYPTTEGQTVRWRVLFRSDALHALSPADLTCLRDELRLSDIVDLRSTFARVAAFLPLGFGREYGIFGTVRHDPDS